MNHVCRWWYDERFLARPWGVSCQCGWQGCFPDQMEAEEAIEHHKGLDKRKIVGGAGMSGYSCPKCKQACFENAPCMYCEGYAAGKTAAFKEVGTKKTAADKDWPECEEFYDLMQAYRFAKFADQKTVTDRYEEIKSWLRNEVVPRKRKRA